MQKDLPRTKLGERDIFDRRSRLHGHRAIGQFFTGSGASPAAMAAVAAVLVVTSLAATVVPATRAARTDPTNALRQE